MVLDKDTNLKFPHVLVIDASAGSGKTETLAMRYVQFILSEKIPHNHISNILAITFTNNAAREMKQRVLEWLKILAGCEPVINKEAERAERVRTDTEKLLGMTRPALKRRARKAVETIIEHYSDFHIQTIDSFMNRILRSSAAELGLPQETEVTESYAMLLEPALNDMVASIGIHVDQREIDEFLDSMNRVRNSFTLDPVSEMDREFTAFLEQEGKVTEELVFDDEWQKVADLYQEIRALYQKVVAAGGKGHVRKPISDAIEDSAIDSFLPAKFLKDYAPDFLWFKKAGYEAFKSLPGSAEILNQIRQKVRDFFETYVRSRYHAHGKIYSHFKHFLDLVKLKEERIHFDDINKQLAHYLKAVLVPEIYFRLGDTLYHFLLDEFQDTDRVQWQNLLPLLDEAYAKGGSLFAVGDMKQAIFMWRKADYRIMRGLVNGIKGMTQGKGITCPRVSSTMPR